MAILNRSRQNYLRRVFGIVKSLFTEPDLNHIEATTEERALLSIGIFVPLSTITFDVVLRAVMI